MKCSSSECDRETHAKGLCFKHYVKFRRQNKLEPKKVDDRICAAEGCGNPFHGKNLCIIHYKRQWDDKNREKLRRDSAEYNRKNKQAVYTKQQEWKKNNWEYYKAYLAAQKKIVKRATPPWMSTHEIIKVFRACPKGMEVDHILPLQGKEVSGLNVPWNMQYLTPFENNSKNNKFDGTYENESWKKILVDKTREKA